MAVNVGATREDLERIAATLDSSPAPLLAHFAPTTLALLGRRKLRTYLHHIEHLVVEFGDRRLDDITLVDLERTAVVERDRGPLR